MPSKKPGTPAASFRNFGLTFFNTLPKFSTCAAGVCCFSPRRVRRAASAIPSGIPANMQFLLLQSIHSYSPFCLFLFLQSRSLYLFLPANFFPILSQHCGFHFLLRASFLNFLPYEFPLTFSPSSSQVGFFPF
jgi:hypothetical protein